MRLYFSRSQFSHKGKGFTLIELLVVISIIGLLASVVLSAVNSARTKGKQAAAYAQARNIVTDVSTCLLNNQANVLWGCSGQSFYQCGSGGGALPTAGYYECGTGYNGGIGSSSPVPDSTSSKWPDVSKFGYSYAPYAGEVANTQSFYFEIYPTGSTGSVTAICCTQSGCSQISDSPSPSSGQYGHACCQSVNAAVGGNCQYP